MRITDKFVFFFSKDDFLSNHYVCKEPFSDHLGGPEFTTVEHYMMYRKAILFGDGVIADQILKAARPQEAKMLGRKVRGFNNAIWDNVKVGIVAQGLYAKMMANPEILAAALSLANKGLTFVEASPYDYIWGIKMGENYHGVEDPNNWKGQNLLGKAWHQAISMCRIVRNGELLDD